MQWRAAKPRRATGALTQRCDTTDGTPVPTLQCMSNLLEELRNLDNDYFTFGTDDRFRIRSQARPPSTKLFPFNTVCFLHGAAGNFTGVLVAPRVVLTVKHALFTNIGPPSCGARLSTSSTTTRGAVTV